MCFGISRAVGKGGGIAGVESGISVFASLVTEPCVSDGWL